MRSSSTLQSRYPGASDLPRNSDGSVRHSSQLSPARGHHFVFSPSSTKTYNNNRDQVLVARSLSSRWHAHQQEKQHVRDGYDKLKVVMQHEESLLSDARLQPSVEERRKDYEEMLKAVGVEDKLEEMYGKKARDKAESWWSGHVSNAEASDTTGLVTGAAIASAEGPEWLRRGLFDDIYILFRV
ncbi:hypothetical protein T439DRAFT_325684 [Meredithblackwellia eburnea MCA 4105]